MRALGDAVGIGGIAVMIGVQLRSAVDPQAVHHAAAVHLRVAVKFEIGIGELGAGIEGFTHLDVQIQHVMPHALKHSDDAL